MAECSGLGVVPKTAKPMTLALPAESLQVLQLYIGRKPLLYPRDQTRVDAAL
jgi:hypothetical protein